MLAVLLILLASALSAFALGSIRALAPASKPAALLGVGLALAVSLMKEGLEGGGAVGVAVDWPPFLSWVGEPLYRSDILAASLGAWCLLLGVLCLLAVRDSHHALAAGVLIIATLYSLSYTSDLRAFATQMLLLAALCWVLGMSPETSGAEQPWILPLGVGAVFIMGAALLIGKITGGQYNLVEMSLSEVSRWPLTLIALGIALWIGLAPFTGWSARGYKGAAEALVQSLVVSVPVVILLLRLQALVTAQGLAGTLPDGWNLFTGAMAWGGGLTALAAGAGTIVAAGTPRWTSYLTAYAGGLMAWGLGPDSPAGRYAALAVLLSYGAARVVLALADSETTRRSSRYISALSLAAIPGTAGFVGVWLLGATLSQTGRPSFVIALLGASVLTACGTVLHFVGQRDTNEMQEGNEEPEQSQTLWREPSLIPVIRYVALIGSILLIIGGIAPGLWLNLTAQIVGGPAPTPLPWTGLATDETTSQSPVLLLGLAALALALIGWAVRVWRRSGTIAAGMLLPTALNHIKMSREGDFSVLDVDPRSAYPAPVWWLSLAWLEAGIERFGSLLSRLGARTGRGLVRLEGRYYLPVAIILALIALLAVAR